MIADLKPYPEYKESGHLWLGDVPTHWDVLPNRAIFSEIKDRDCPDEEMLSVTITRGIVPQKALLAGSSKKDSSNTNKAAYKLVQPGDIAYNKMRAWQGALGASNLRGIISPAYVVMRPMADANPLYFHNLYRTPMFAKEAERWSYGITSDMWSLRPEHFKLIGSLLPPPAEQSAIVRFLDHWNGRFEKAIRSKRRVIALLQEQKQAIIHRAVTRGLDLTVKLKDSGIPWLGDIPAHWEVYRLSFLADFSNGKAHEQFFDSEGEFVCVNARFVSTSGTGIKYCTQNFWPARRGDVLMVMSDLPNGRALARAYLVNDDRKYAVNQRVCRLRSKRVEAGFLAYAANRNYGLLRHDDGSNQTHLSTGDYKTLPIQCPPAADQQAIVRYLDAHVSKADVLVASLEREITLLREYRTRLTADVVTGKLDVRAAAAQMPEEAEEETLPDPEIPEEETELEEVEG